VGIPIPLGLLNPGHAPAYTSWVFSQKLKKRVVQTRTVWVAPFLWRVLGVFTQKTEKLA